MANNNLNNNGSPASVMDPLDRLREVVLGRNDGNNNNDAPLLLIANDDDIPQVFVTHRTWGIPVRPCEGEPPSVVVCDPDGPEGFALTRYVFPNGEREFDEWCDSVDHIRALWSDIDDTPPDDRVRDTYQPWINVVCRFAITWGRFAVPSNIVTAMGWFENVSGRDFLELETPN